MKILFISDYYPPHIKGGAEISTSLLADWLVSQGNQVDVICSDIVTEPWIEKGIRVYPVLLQVSLGAKDLISSVQYAFGVLVTPLRSISRVMKIVRELKPDVVNVIPSSYLFIPVILAVRLFAKIPVIVDCRDYCLICPRHLTNSSIRNRKGGDEDQTHHGYRCFLNYKPANKFLLLFVVPFAIYESLVFNSYKAMLKFVVNNRGGVYMVGVSKYVQNQLILNGFKPSKTDNIYNIAPVSHTVSGEGVSVPPYAIAYAGRIEEDKGVWDLVKAAQLLNQLTTTPYTLKMAGTGEDSSKLEEYIRNENVQNVALLGKLTPAEVSALYQESIAIVAPSRWQEPFGRFILEAISAGKPLISTYKGGIPEGIKPGITGVLVQAGDVQGLTLAMKDFIETPGKSASMRDDILKEAHMYTSERIGTQRLQLYKKAFDEIL